MKRIPLKPPTLFHLCALIVVLGGLVGTETISAGERQRSLAGELLVATPEIKDPRFAETVIYVVRHDENGAFGLVVNRPLAKGPYVDLLQSFGGDTQDAKGEVIIHYGGPVNTDQGFVLHSDDVVLESSTKVRDGIAMTADVKMVEAMARGKGPKQSLVIFGYAGWAPGQLESELQENSWFVIGGDKSLIFGPDADEKWRRAIDKRQIPL